MGDIKIFIGSGDLQQLFIRRMYTAFIQELKKRDVESLVCLLLLRREYDSRECKEWTREPEEDDDASSSRQHILLIPFSYFSAM